MKKIKKKIDYYKEYVFETGVLYQLPDFDLLCAEQHEDTFVFKHSLERANISVKKNTESAILPVPNTAGVKIVAGRDSFEVVFAGPKLM